jgi:hypothetical protein
MRYIDLPPFQNVVNTGKAVCNLLLGDTYGRIQLKIVDDNGTAVPNVGRLRGWLNGKLFVDLTAAELTSINLHNTLIDGAGYLTLDFMEYHSKTVPLSYVGIIPTGPGCNGLRLEVEMIGAANPIINGKAIVFDSMPLIDKDGNQARIKAYLSQSLSFAAAGKQPFLLPYQPGAPVWLQRLHLMSAQITALEVKINSSMLVDNVPLADMKNMLEAFDMVPQANIYTLDMIITGDITQTLNLEQVQNVVIAPTISALTVVSVVGEWLAQLKDL